MAIVISPEPRVTAPRDPTALRRAQPAAAQTPVTHVTWARDFLGRIGAPVTAGNLTAVIAWMLAEGGWWSNHARFNPLDTTQRAAGSTPMNSVGVQSFPDYETGLQATVETITNGRYQKILDALRQNRGPDAVASAVVSSPWGTNSAIFGTTSVAATILGGGRPDSPAPDRATLVADTNPFPISPTVPGGTAGDFVGLAPGSTQGNRDLLNGLFGKTTIDTLGDPLGLKGNSGGSSLLSDPFGIREVARDVGLVLGGVALVVVGLYLVVGDLRGSSLAEAVRGISRPEARRFDQAAVTGQQNQLAARRQGMLGEAGSRRDTLGRREEPFPA